MVLVMLLVLAGLALSGCAVPAGDPYSGTVKYTLYIGLNDKDTYTQLIPYEEAEQKVSGIALKYVDGFTVLSARGAYKDDKGSITHENSLVVEFFAATEQQMKSIMDEVLKEFNQQAILLEKQSVSREFYEGEKP